MVAIALPLLLIFPLFGAFLLAQVVPSTIQNWSEEQRLRIAGQPLTATIVDREDTSNRTDGSSYAVSYTYQVTLANGEQPVLQRREPVVFDLYQRLEPGSRVELLYLPEDPAVARLTQNLNSSSVNVITLVGFVLIWTVVFCGLPLYLALRLIQGWRKERRLGREGQLVIGELLAFDGRLDSDDDYAIELRYRFRSPSGTVIEDRATGIHNELKGSELSIGTPVAIWYRDERSYTLL